MQIKIDLLFPLGWGVATMPHLALPTLTGFLRSKGAFVKQRDLNIEMIHYMFSPQYTRWLSQMSLRKLSQDRPRAFYHGKDLRTDLLLSVKLLESIPGRFLSSVSQLKKEDVRETIKKQGERQLLFKQLSFAISSLYSPNKVDIFHNPFSAFYTPDFNQSITDVTLSNMFSHSLNEENNFFYDIYSKYLFGRGGKNNSFHRLVGISIARSSQIISALVLARLIKEKQKGVFIVFGGPMVAYMEEAVKNFPRVFDLVDCFIKGEGELPLWKLAKNLDKRKTLLKLPQLIMRGSVEPVSKPAKDVLPGKEFPLPDFSDIDLGQYFSSQKCLPYSASRGCYWNKCVFCSLNSSYGGYRQAQTAKVSKEIKVLSKRYGCKIFYFVDECVHPDRLNKIAESFIKNSLGIFWVVEARPEKGFSPGVFKKAYLSGCRLISWGIESGSEKVLALINKGTDLRQASFVLRNAHKADIWNNAYFILAFPGENHNDLKATVNFILKHKRYLDSVNPGPLYIQRHSHLFNHPELFNISIQDVPKDFCGDIFPFRYNERLYGDVPISEVFRVDVCKKIDGLHFRPKAYWTNLIIISTRYKKEKIRKFMQSLPKPRLEWI